MITISTPWALLLLLLLPAAAALGASRIRRLPGWRGPTVLALRLLILSLLVVAVADPEQRTGARAGSLSVVFLVDASDSVGTAGQHAAMAWAQRAAASAAPQDTAGVVLFGATPRLAVPPGHYGTLPDPTGGAGSATDLGAAIRFGLALLTPDTTGRLVLLSDGRNTSGDLSGALALALTRGVAVDTVAIAPPERRDVAVSALDVPRTARMGDQIPVRLTLASSDAITATVGIVIDGQEVRKQVRLPVGDTVLTAQARLTSPGLHTVHVQVDAPGDAVPQNNGLDATTVAGPPGSVLLVTSNPASKALSAVLAHDQLEVHTITPSGLPGSAAAYQGDDAVVLDNVSPAPLSEAQQRALRDAVSESGLGLLAIGGGGAFGTGDPSRVPLQQALPIRGKPAVRPVRAPLALMLVIDKSGSMSEPVRGVAKIDMAKVAAASAVDHLQDGDAVGVVAFDDGDQTVVPFHVLHGSADRARVRREIAGITADGGTTIYPALQQAARAVSSLPTPNRHIVLLTDGQGEDAPFSTLIQQMRRQHTILSTIGVGDDVLQDELRRWASLGGGLFHYVADPHSIPRIIVSETRYRALGKAVQGTIRLAVASASPLLRSLAGRALPPIGGYELTRAKPAAQVAVQTPGGDPVLASWQYGLGRVVAWASDDGTGSWAQGWGAGRFPRFWTDAVRWALRGYTPLPGTPVLTSRDGVLDVSVARRTSDGLFDDTATPRVQVVGPSGPEASLPLELVAPGSYQATRPLSGAGIYAAAVEGGGRDPSAVGALAVPYSAEYVAGGVDTPTLLRIAAATGGHALGRPVVAFAHPRLPSIPVWRPLWPALLLLALLLFPLDVALRLRWAGHARRAPRKARG